MIFALFNTLIVCLLFRYTKPVPSLAFETQVAENPEMRVPAKKSPVIVGLIDELDSMTKVNTS